MYKAHSHAISKFCLLAAAALLVPTSAAQEEAEGSENGEVAPAVDLQAIESEHEVARMLFDFRTVETESGPATELICPFKNFIWTSEGFNGYSVEVFEENTNINVTWDSELKENPRWYTCSSISPKFTPSLGPDYLPLVSNSTYQGTLMTYALHKIEHASEPGSDRSDTVVRVTAVDGYIYFPCDAWYLRTNAEGQLVQKDYYPQKPDKILPVYYSYLRPEEDGPEGALNITQKCDTPSKTIEYMIYKAGDEEKPYITYTYRSAPKSLIMVMSEKSGGSGAFWFGFFVFVVFIGVYEGEGLPIGNSGGSDGPRWSELMAPPLPPCPQTPSRKICHNLSVGFCRLKRRDL